EPDAAAEVDLEPLDVVAVSVRHELTLEPDVGDLDARAGVRAAVEVNRDRSVEFRNPLLELCDELSGATLRLDDPELAELDARACHGRPTPGARSRRQPEVLHGFDQGVDLGLVDVEDHELLVRRRADPGGAVCFDDVGELAERRTGNTANRR